MAARKSSLRSLPRKGISTRKASTVKGGMRKEVKDKLATNHNLVTL